MSPVLKTLFAERFARKPFKPHDNFHILEWARQIVSENFPDFICLKTALELNPSLRVSRNYAKEPQVIQVTAKYELAAAHQLWNAEWDTQRNFQEFGKCSNAAGHGHNYLLEVTVEAPVLPEGSQQLISLEKLDETVNQHIIEPFDHKNLSHDLPQFQNLIPTVENMVRVFWDILAPHFAEPRLGRIAVWETPRTYAEYFGPADGPLRYSDNI